MQVGTTACIMRKHRRNPQAVAAALACKHYCAARALGRTGPTAAHPHALAAAQALLQRAQPRHEARVGADARALRGHKLQCAAQAPVLPARAAVSHLWKTRAMRCDTSQVLCPLGLHVGGASGCSGMQPL